MDRMSAFWNCFRLESEVFSFDLLPWPKISASFKYNRPMRAFACMRLCAGYSLASGCCSHCERVSLDRITIFHACEFPLMEIIK